MEFINSTSPKSLFFFTQYFLISNWISRWKMNYKIFIEFLISYLQQKNDLKIYILLNFIVTKSIVQRKIFGWDDHSGKLLKGGNRVKHCDYNVMRKLQMTLNMHLFKWKNNHN